VNPEPDLLVGNWGFRPGVTRRAKGVFWAGEGNFFLFNTTLSTRRLCINDKNMPPPARVVVR